MRWKALTARRDYESARYEAQWVNDHTPDVYPVTAVVYVFGKPEVKKVYTSGLIEGKKNPASPISSSWKSCEVRRLPDGTVQAKFRGTSRRNPRKPFNGYLAFPSGRAFDTLREAKAQCRKDYKEDGNKYGTPRVENMDNGKTVWRLGQ
jgi:hypothetical protein